MASKDAVFRIKLKGEEEQRISFFNRSDLKVAYPFSCHSFSWPHLTARETGKCSLAVCPRKIKNGFANHLAISGTIFSFPRHLHWKECEAQTLVSSFHLPSTQRRGINDGYETPSKPRSHKEALPWRGSCRPCCTTLPDS